jgi:hypothetical protein
MRTVSFLTLTSQEPENGSRTESIDHLSRVSYTVQEAEATVVCRNGNERSNG